MTQFFSSHQQQYYLKSTAHFSKRRITKKFLLFLKYLDNIYTPSFYKITLEFSYYSLFFFEKNYVEKQK